MTEYIISDDTKLAIEVHRTYWAKIARDNGWYTDPFYVQVWVRRKDGVIIDSVSFAGITGDVVITCSR